jgi:hypothetical protein
MSEYNAELLQERNVGILKRRGFKVVETLENQDIRLTKNGAGCIVDTEGNVRWTDGKAGNSRTNSD